MKTKISLFLAVATLLFVLAPRAAHADLGYWSAALIGAWKNPETGEIYRFNSDATYTMTAPKPDHERIVGSSGWWKIVQPTEKESGGSQEGPVALLIKQRKITFLEESGRRHTENFKTDYRLVVNTVIVDDAENRNLYTIDDEIWKRIK